MKKLLSLFTALALLTLIHASAQTTTNTTTAPVDPVAAALTAAVPVMNNAAAQLNANAANYAALQGQFNASQQKLTQANATISAQQQAAAALAVATATLKAAAGTTTPPATTGTTPAP